VRAFVLGPLLRLFPIGLCVLALQRTVFTELRPFDVAIQVVLALVAGAGAGAGPERGAVAGFVLGIMYDLAVGTPLGLIALVYALAGYVAGYVLTLTPSPQWWLAAIFVGVGAAVGETAVPVAKTLVGQDGWFTTRLLTIVPVVAVFSLVASPILTPLGRWCMCVKKPSWKAIPE
jgi:rod shape-determining protein MreD